MDRITPLHGNGHNGRMPAKPSSQKRDRITSETGLTIELLQLNRTGREVVSHAPLRREWPLTELPGCPPISGRT